MPFKLKISHKGIILVSVPLIFELVFVLVLTSLLHQAEAELKREAHSKAIISHANDLMRGILDASTAAGAYNLTRAPMFGARYEMAVGNVASQFCELDVLVRDNPDQLSNLRRIKITADNMIVFLTKLKRGSEDETPTLAALLGRPRDFGTVKSSIEQLSIGMRSFLEGEREIERISPVQQERNRQNIELALMGGLGLNIVLALSLALFFSRGITRRLRVLIDNTLRLSRAQKLHPPLGGSDEIAHLDKVFHTMVSDLRELDRLKQEFVSMVSHELKSPLTSVQGTLTLLEEGALGEISPKAKDRVQKAEVDVRRLITLINDLLDIDKIESGKLEMYLEDVQLSQVLERSVISVQGMADQQGVLLSILSTDAVVYGDEDRLVQVVINLLSNAIKYSRAGQTVTVTVEDLPGQAQVKVIDHGRGIPSEYKSLVFERFRQVEAADTKVKGGTGLGLTICKKIVEQLGGTIGVESEEGQGSTFWFSIPKRISLNSCLREPAAEALES